MSTERLNQSGEKIKESKRTLLRTEELGVSILQDLHSQRQTLLHAHNNVGSIFSSFPVFIHLSHHSLSMSLPWVRYRVSSPVYWNVPWTLNPKPIVALH
jgi:hypothetical protein